MSRKRKQRNSPAQLWKAAAKEKARREGRTMEKGVPWPVRYNESMSGNSYAPEAQQQPDPKHGEETRRRVEAMQEERRKRREEEAARRERERTNAEKAARAAKWDGLKHAAAFIALATLSFGTVVAICGLFIKFLSTP